ncbi:MAG: hypothetical protein IJ722_06210 [Alloprevotella sp.]|nr:hypothetical protein [Alloprevotella sp.]
MKRNQSLLLAALLAFPVAAQDIYKVENFSGEDLNGTSRFVGMGGAMNALGADLSTIGTNPAAIGLYRRSDFALTGSLSIQPNGAKMDDIGKTRASFDQIGFVYAAPINSDHLKFVNIGFNYQKRRNMKNYIGISGPLRDGISQTWQMADLGNYYGIWDDGTEEFVSPLAEAGFQSGAISGNPLDGSLIGFNAGDYALDRIQYGSIQQYAFNISFNTDNRWYFGLTLGAYNVNWNSYTYYREQLLDPADMPAGVYHAMDNDERISGSGFDMKFGFIGRPVEDSPFRIGLSVSTPTWYNLTGNNVLRTEDPGMDDAGNITTNSGYVPTKDFDYRITTPWKFNVSLATTVEDWLAIDAEYEYKDYKGASVRYPKGYYNYDWSFGNNVFGNTYKDRPLGKEIDKYMRGVSTFRIGLEAKLAKGVFARLGYNYVSSPFKDDAYKNFFIGQDTPDGDSEGIINSTGTEYVNLGAINRVTAGFGYRGKHWYADIAYQFQAQKGDVCAFHVFKQDDSGNIVGDHRTNMLPKQSFDLNRQNVMLTVGYKF